MNKKTIGELLASVIFAIITQGCAPKWAILKEENLSLKETKEEEKTAEPKEQIEKLIQTTDLRNTIVKYPNNISVGTDYSETKSIGTRKRKAFTTLTYPIQDLGFIEGNFSLTDADYYKKLKPGTSTIEKNINLSVLYELIGKESTQEKRTFKPIGIYLGPKGEFSEVDYPNKTNPRGYESQFLGGLELFIPLNETQIDLNVLSGNGRIGYINGATSRIYDSSKINLSASHLLNKDSDLELKADISHTQQRTIGVADNFNYKERQKSNEFTAGISKGVKIGEEAKLFLGADFFSKRAVLAEEAGDKTLYLSSGGFTVYSKLKTPLKTEKLGGQLELAVGYTQEYGSKAYEVWGKRNNGSYNLMAIFRW